MAVLTFAHQARRWLHNTRFALFASAAFLTGLLGFAWFAYAPGLSGGFLFDDLGNLPALGDYGPVDNWKTFLHYITSGFADPTGRPLAMLSFLLDANDWPADPEPFKRTNILLHLLNGVLLCRLLLQLGRCTLRPERQVEFAALLGMGLWLLHPLWVSTTLYVVQREAMLAGTFMLLGLLAYLHGRRVIAERPLAGVFWCVGVVGMCTLIGLLAKANAILLPLLITAVELVFLRAQPGSAAPSRHLALSLRWAIYPPAVAVCVYLLYIGLHGVLHGIGSSRPWTPGQRLLTEPRVVLDYLNLLVVPRPYSHGLFNDDYLVSRDWFHPWSTLPALLVIFGLFTAAIVARQRHPAPALAVVFFFAGHAMESSTIPLELYFEHRNYVPAMLMFWPFALWLAADGKPARLKLALAAAALILLTLETRMAAELWGEPGAQAQVWALQNPDSPRAQIFAASKERASGHLIQAENRLRRAIATHPDEIQLAVNLLGTTCQRGFITESDVIMAEQALRTGSIRGLSAFDWIETGIDLVRKHSCEGMQMDTLQRLVEAARQNPGARDLPRFTLSMDNLEGQIAIAQGNGAIAEQKFLSVLKADPRPDVALRQAALLGSNNLPQAGLRQLDYYELLATTNVPEAITNMGSLHRYVMRKTGYWKNEITHMRSVLMEDAAKESIRPSANN